MGSLFEQCRSCQAKILWAITPAGKRMPVDHAPSDDGNILLVHTAMDTPLAVVLSKEGLEMASRSPMGLRTSHFATCPNAEEHRRAGE